MKYLQAIELQKRGDRVGLVRKKEDSDCDSLKFAWIDRKGDILFVRDLICRMENQT